MVFAQSSGPRSETELMLHRPASHRPGTLPPGLLPHDEHVIFETRPSLLRLYWGRLTLLAFFLLLWTSLLAFGGVTLLLDPLWLIVEVLQLALVARSVLDWDRTAFVLTNRRILRVSGMRHTVFQDAQLDQVENLALEGGFSGGIRFTVGPGSVPGGRSPTTGRARTLRWDGLPDAAPVYTFVQQAFALRTHQLEVADPASPHHPSAGVIQCPECGTVLESRNLSHFRPVCIRCGHLFARPA